MQLAHFAATSEANGPGVNSVFWFAGCTLGCKGCINKHLWTAEGESRTPYELLKMVDPAAQGICLTGGEPLQQPLSEVLTLLRSAKSAGLQTTMFTGYTLEEIEARECFAVCTDLVDVLISGRYDATQKCDEPLRASLNQQVVTQNRLQEVADSEVVMDLDTGRIYITGVHRL